MDGISDLTHRPHQRLEGLAHADLVDGTKKIEEIQLDLTQETN